MLDPYIFLYWYRRLVLSPLGLTSPVELVHAAGNCIIGDGNSRQPLLEVLKASCPSLIGIRAWYSGSLWLCNSSHFQTGYGALADFTKVFRIEYERKYLQVPDGGTIYIDITPPLSQVPPDNRPILVCMHGLTGGSHESYIRTVLDTLTKPKEKGGEGWRAIVVNSRGCAQGPLTTPKLYHAGASYDLKNAMLYIGHMFPDAPIYGIGFSLGAGMLTKYLAVEADRTAMKTGIALGCPWDLMLGHIDLQSSLRGLFYSRAMGGNLRTVLQRHLSVMRQNPKLDVDAIIANPNLTIYEFDTLITSKCGGFTSTEQYYRSQSPKNFVGNIRVPFLSINALDDPIATSRGIPLDVVQKNPNIVFALTRHGGHLGWFAGPFSFITKKRWVVRPIIEWLKAIHTADPAPRKHKAISEAKAPRQGDDMVIDPEDPECGFKELGEDAITGGDDPTQDSLVAGL